MNKKKKKSFIILLVSIFTVLTITFAYSNSSFALVTNEIKPTASCNNHGDWINIYSEGRIPLNSTSHLTSRVWGRRCGKNIDIWWNCDYYEEINSTTSVDNHSKSFIDRHSGSTHSYGHSCSPCGWSDVITYNCPGNPCITPLSVSEPQDVHDCEMIHDLNEEEISRLHGELQEEIQNESSNYHYFENEIVSDDILKLLIEGQKNYTEPLEMASEVVNNSCTHRWMTYYSIEYRPGNTGHIVVTSRGRVCLECETKEINTESYVESHSMQTISDYHSGNTHTIVQACSKCSHTNQFSYNCSGNPCIYPYSIPELLDNCEDNCENH